MLNTTANKHLHIKERWMESFKYHLNVVHTIAKDYINSDINHEGRDIYRGISYKIYVVLCITKMYTMFPPTTNH